MPFSCLLSTMLTLISVPGNTWDLGLPWHLSQKTKAKKKEKPKNNPKTQKYTTCPQKIIVSGNIFYK